MSEQGKKGVGGWERGGQCAGQGNGMWAELGAGRNGAQDSAAGRLACIPTHLPIVAALGGESWRRECCT